MMTLLIALLLQDPKPADEKKPQEGAPLEAVYKDGFRLKGGEFELVVGGHLYVQGRHLAGRPDDAARTSGDTLYLRQARLELYGTLYRDFEFKVMYDSQTGSSASAFDAYGGWKPCKAFALRVGQFKAPFGVEQTLSDAITDFIERGEQDRLTPSRDLGAMAYGKLFGDRFGYEAGFFNGSGRNTLDSSEEKEAVLRLRFSPFAGDEGLLKHLRLGAAGTYGDVDNASIAGLDFATANLALLWLDSTAGTIDGLRTRLGAELAFAAGPFGLRAEWLTRRDRVDVGSFDDAAVRLSGWTVTVAFILTGEGKPLEGKFEPAARFDLKAGAIGAVELVARASRLDVGDAIFNTGAASPLLNSGGVTAISGGVNWHLHKNAKIMLNAVLERFDDDISFANGDLEDQFFGVIWRFHLDI